MALIDIDGTAVGSVTLTGPLAVSYGLGETMEGSGDPSTSTSVLHEIPYTVTGAASVSANEQSVFNFSGFAIGSGDALDASIKDVDGVVTGSGSVTGDLVRIIGVQGATYGSSLASISVPEPIFGVAIVTAHMEVIHVGYPICETPQVQKSFRWGHQFGTGDLDICVTKGGNPLGPVCITFTMYQIQRGCQLLQKGPGGRRPVTTSRVGCYYATGTAGECGQPGLWMIRWRYQGTFGGPWVEKDCYFYVLDSVLCPVPGDTLVRECKYGWD